MKYFKKLIVVTALSIIWISVFAILQFTFPGILFNALVFELIPGNELIGIIILGFVSISFWVVTYFMRRMVILGMIICLFMMLLPLNASIWFLRDYSRSERMNEILHALESLQSNNKLPKSLSDAPYLQKISSGIFGIDRIECELNGNNFIIRSYGVPLGPFELYSSERAEWYYEE